MVPRVRLEVLPGRQGAEVLAAREPQAVILSSSARPLNAESKDLGGGSAADKPRGVAPRTSRAG